MTTTGQRPRRRPKLVSTPIAPTDSATHRRIRIDGAGASHELIDHLLGMSSPQWKVLFTCGWAITGTDEAAIMAVPASAWKPGIAQDGSAEQDKDAAEIRGLMSRAGNWPGGLRWTARRVKPSRRHMKNLTDYERKTGWKYSITCTSNPDTGIPGVPGSHHPQYMDALHRDHASCVFPVITVFIALGALRC